MIDNNYIFVLFFLFRGNCCVTVSGVRAAIFVWKYANVGPVTSESV